MIQHTTLYKFQFINMSEIPDDQAAFFAYIQELVAGELSWYKISKKLGIAQYSFTRYRKDKDDEDFSTLDLRIKQDIIFVVEEFLANKAGQNIDLSIRYDRRKIGVPAHASLICDIHTLAEIDTSAELAQYLGMAESTLKTHTEKLRPIVGRKLRDLVNLRYDLLEHKKEALASSGQDTGDIDKLIESFGEDIKLATNALTDKSVLMPEKVTCVKSMLGQI